MRHDGRFNFDDFFNRLFVLRFPKALSSLEIGFRKLSQSHPTKVGIVEYGSRFAVFVKKLGLSLKGNYLKFVEGLTNPEVRVAMLRFPFHDLSYEMLISTAVGIENSVSISRSVSQARALMNSENDDFEVGEDDQIYKIHGKPLGEYLAALKAQNIGDKICFQCFNRSHLAQRCYRLKCRFCSRVSSECGHLSLLCPKAPKDIKGLISGVPQPSTPKVKFVEDEDVAEGELINLE